MTTELKEIIVFWLAVISAIIVFQGSRTLYYWLKDKREKKRVIGLPTATSKR